jgi:type I restriction enzyme M protein
VLLLSYEAADRDAVQSERWTKITREQIENKGFSLDFGLIRDENLTDHETLPPIEDIAEDTLDALEVAMEHLKWIVKRVERYKNV